MKRLLNGAVTALRVLAGFACGVVLTTGALILQRPPQLPGAGLAFVVIAVLSAMITAVAIVVLSLPRLVQGAPVLGFAVGACAVLVDALSSYVAPFRHFEPSIDTHSALQLLRALVPVGTALLMFVITRRRSSPVPLVEESPRASVEQAHRADAAS